MAELERTFDSLFETKRQLDHIKITAMEMVNS